MPLDPTTTSTARQKVEEAMLSIYAVRDALARDDRITYDACNKATQRMIEAMNLLDAIPTQPEDLLEEEAQP